MSSTPGEPGRFVWVEFVTLTILLITHMRLLLCGLLLVACKKDAPLWQIQNLNQNRIAVIGHGGMGILNRDPMNSFNSLQEAIALSSDGTEMDVQMSADHHLWLFHPNTLNEGTNGSGSIRSKTDSQLSTIHYTHPIGQKPALVQATYFFEKASHQSGKTFVFDCKVESREEDEFLNRFAEALLALIKQHELTDKCLIESYNIDFLKKLQAANPELKLFIHGDRLSDCLEAAKYVKLYGITMDRNKITAEEIAEAHRQNLRVALFNLDTKQENLQGIQLSPDYLQTDKMDYLLEVLKH